MRYTKIFSTLSIISFIFLFSNLCFSQTYWKTITTSATWNNSAHWQKSTDFGSTWIASGGSYPNSTNDYVYDISGTLACNVSVTVCAVRVPLSKTLTVSATFTLSVTNGASATQSAVYGTITNSGTLTIGSGITFYNYGTITNSGTLNNNSAGFCVHTDGSYSGTLTNSASKTLNNTGTITVSSGCTLINSGTYSNNSGTLSVSGTFDNRANLTANGTITIAATGTYKHNFLGTSSAGTIPTCTWSAGSTCEWSGNGNVPNLSLGLSQSFYHFKIKRSHTGTVTLDLPATFTVLGNLTISSTGTGNVYLGYTNNVTMNISGNLQYDSGAVFGNAYKTLTINIGGNYTQAAGIFTLQPQDPVAVMTVSGNTTITGGYLYLNVTNQKTLSPEIPPSVNSDAPSAVNCTLILKGDLTILLGGALTCDYYAELWFNKTGTQTYTSGGTLSGFLNFFVKSGAVLAFATSSTVLYCPLSSFTLESGGGMIISHKYGLSSSLGCIGPSISTFSSGGNYEFCSGVSQVAGDKLPLTVNNFTKSGTDTLVLTNASLTVSGTATWTAGVFSIPAKTLTMNGSIVNTAGTIKCNSSTVLNVGGSGSTSVLPSITNGAGSLTINRSAGVTMGGPLSVVNLTLTSGNLSLSAYTLSLSGTYTPIGGILVSQSTSGLSIGGPGGSAFAIPSNITALSDLTINRTNGVSLSADLSVSGTLTLTAGTLTLGAYTLTLGASSSVSGTPSASSMIITNAAGVLRKMFSGTGTFTFPVGTSSDYTPATVTFTTGTFGAGAYLDLLTVASKHGSNTSGTDYLKRYWTFNQYNITNFTYNINLQYISPADVIGTEANIYTGKWDGSTWQQFAQANTTTHQLTGTGAASFSTFTGGQQSAMPVTLSSFTSSVSGQNITLRWTTSSEQNNTGFEIQRTPSSENQWVTAGTINGKGTTTTPTNYTFLDKNLPTGKYQYRLKQTDHNGNSEYHTLPGTVEIALPTKYELFQNYPNPFNSTTVIKFSIPNTEGFPSLEGYAQRGVGNVTLKLYDITGREVLTIINNEYKPAGYYTINLNASSLSSGVYFYRMVSNKFIETKKLTLIK